MRIVDRIKNLYKISIVSIALILLLVSTSLAATKKSASPKITETQITTSGSRPAIYGDRIVWDNYRNGNDDIYMYDLSTKKETQITTNDSNQGFPAIYNDKIVWVDWRSSEHGLTDLYMYDLSTSNESMIDTDYHSEYLEDPAIYGDKVIWANTFEETSYVSIYDLSTKKETQIGTSGRAYNPAIYGNRIVWQDDRDGNYKYNIYMYDLSTKKETRITTRGSAGAPAIYGNKIAWTDYRNGNADIYMYDLSTKKETQITSSPDDQRSPAIYGNRIVWQDDGGADDGWVNHGIYMYDISTNQKMKISTNGSAYNSAIYGNNIVWQYNDGNIYMATVEVPQPKTPVAAFSASPRSGKAPLKVTFTDKSSNNPTSWKWSFGDKTYSTARNPAHKYSKAGKYTVSLTAKNAKGSNTKTISGYIVAKK